MASITVPAGTNGPPCERLYSVLVPRSLATSVGARVHRSMCAVSASLSAASLDVLSAKGGDWEEGAE